MSDWLVTVENARNRRLRCAQYVVAETYVGWQIRTPSEECNQHLLKVIRRDAVRVFGELLPVQIIEPVRRPDSIDYPPFRVIAAFTSSPMREEMHLSGLIVAWFQDEPAPVPDAAGRTAISALDWEGLSRDYEI